MITVITQSTIDRKTETIQLFENIRDYLDEGLSYRRALIHAGVIKPDTTLNNRNGWFRELTDYGETQGYSYHECKFKTGVKNPVRAWDYTGLFF